MSVFGLLGSGAMDATNHLIQFTAERHNVLADNVANIDTPGYKMKDLSVAEFQKTLSRMIERGKRANPNVFRLDGDAVDAGDPEEAAKLRGIVFHDDNDRSIERLSVGMAQNATRYTFALNALRSQLRVMRSVIAENPNQ